MPGLVAASQKNRIAVLGGALPITLAAIATLQSYLPAGIPRAAAADLFVWLILAALATAGGLLVRDWLRELGYGKRDRLPLAIFLACMYGAGILLGRLYFSAEDSIKIYDSTVYWMNVIADQQAISESIPNYLVHLRETFAREYNHLAALPLIPVSRILGIDYAGYCLSVLLVYYFPTCLFLTILILRLFALARETKPGVIAFIACFCLCALCVCFLWPVLNGYLDVCGALLFAILLNVTLQWDCTVFSARRNLVLAALSLLPVLLRRWYAFNIVGFYFAFGVTACLAMLAGKSFSLKKFGSLIMNMIMIAVVCALCFFIVNPTLFALFLGGNYATAYSAMKTMGMLRNMLEIAENMGILWIAAAYLGMFLLLKGDKTRLICLRLLITVGLSFYLFCRIQYMGYHQDYLVLPILLTFCGVAYAHIVDFAAGKKLIPLVVLLFAATVANFLYGYTPGLQSIAATTEPLTTVMRRYPQKNDNAAVIRKIVDDLAERIGDSSRYVYVVGDSGALSPELLKRSHLPDQLDAAPFVLVNSIMDLRDGFPSQLFLADYVLLHDPLVSEFVNPQQVSRQAGEMLLEDEIAEAYYRREADYPVSTGNIVLFRKINSVDKRLVDNLKERLRSFYPDVPFVYEPNYFIALFQPDGDARYSFDYWDDRSFIVRKPAGLPAAMRLDGTGGLSTLSFAISCWDAGLELRIRNQNGEIARLPVEQGTRIPYSMDVGDSEFVSIIVTEAEPESRIAGTVVLVHPDLR